MPEMDRDAADEGLGHWSCVSPSSNEWWVRIDGYRFHFSILGEGTWPDALREIDADTPFTVKTEYKT